MANIEEKQCAGCKSPKGTNEFYKNKTNGDGFSTYCKECTKLHAKTYYQKKLVKAVKKETILRKNLKSVNITPPSNSGIESSLKLALMERHLVTALNLLQEYKQELEIFGVSK